MANILLSEAEKTYILHGIQKNYRNDGRSNRDYRPMELELDIVVHASGSARLRLANTDILVGVKAEIDTPNPDRPNEATYKQIRFKFRRFPLIPGGYPWYFRVNITREHIMEDLPIQPMWKNILF